MSFLVSLFKVGYVVLGLIIGSYTIQHAVDFHKEKQAARIEPSTVTAASRDRELKCLALNVYHEAGVEPFEGKIAVAQVTLNRAESKSFPSDLCEVVYQKNTFVNRTICQFSWYCLNPSKLAPTNTTGYAESYEAAKRVLLENYRLSSIEKALYYHADYVNPQWKYKRVAKIGRHIFYEGK